MELPQLPSRSCLKITDVPADLQQKMLRNIEDYSIVLLVDGQLCGTGTLVTIDGIDGILTAAHVAQRLDKSGREAGRPITLATVLDRRGSNPVGEPVKNFEQFAPHQMRQNGDSSDPTLPLCAFLPRASSSQV
jgi:hypothetical protein